MKICDWCSRDVTLSVGNTSALELILPSKVRADFCNFKCAGSFFTNYPNVPKPKDSEPKLGIEYTGE